MIAIILFGITEILQAKELSALLGGISGYILGRVTTDRSSPVAATSGGSGRAVKASTISFEAPNVIRNTAPTFGAFFPGMRIRVAGRGANRGEYTVASATPLEIKVAEQTLKSAPAGAAVSITPV